MHPAPKIKIKKLKREKKQDREKGETKEQQKRTTKVLEIIYKKKGKEKDLFRYG